jgi:nitroimidazol reductase NimA-like FMN-containing flavoprotein (pyridoxamine 5'-phosphate oxidase superfamily)
MVLREMSRDECLRVLAGAKVARLACVHENQPYVVPVSLVCHQPSSDEAYLYGFTTPGQKLDWMRANPLVCVEVDEVEALDQWMSVIANGQYQELPETPGSDADRLRAPKRPQHVAEAMPPWSVDSRKFQCDDERERAWQILQTHPVWWEPGCTAWAVRPHPDPAEPFRSVFYRIRIDRVTGREASRDPRDAISSAVQAPHPSRGGWLGWTRTRVFGSESKGDGSAS